MDAIGQLVHFYETIAEDQRISTTHICLYMALFRAWLATGCQNPVSLQRASIMRDAKISARSTYNKCLRDLHVYGYVKYMPSFNCWLRSQVFIVPLR